MSESMRVSHRDAQTRTDDTQTCEECGGQLLDDGAETVCDDCGLVADEDASVSLAWFVAVWLVIMAASTLTGVMLYFAGVLL